ncbi:maleylpyruvate isomerase N-terminal domain-containing protein [Phytohabitans kaempferiae]|uniref:Maleylpyruvate isomerase N-terminal domain-containing protein n=1 Tax=Phytohabitans kaempferiae TaxID=1620943 RepID=A0ABV6M551_9ACTN
MSIRPQQWRQARGSLPDVLPRLLDLAESVPADRLVTAHWTVADTLAHLATITALDVALARNTPPDLPVPGLDELLAVTTVDTVAGMNDKIMARFTERRVPELTARLRADVESLLEATGDADPAREVDWLGGSRVHLAGLLAHLLNEFNIHAWDIARAVGAPWHTDPRDATQFVEVFLTGVARCGYGRLLDREGRVRPGRIAVTFAPREGAPVTLALTDGRVTLEPPDPRPDVRLSYDPATFNLMMFGRVGKAKAVVTGKLAVGGRRPWLLPAFLRTMRVPS